MKLDDWSYVSKWRRIWQLDEERRALATLGLDADVTLQSADAVVDDGQAQPESAVPEFAVATGMSAIEAAEDRLQLGFGNANAVVTNSYGADVGSLARRVANSRSRFSRVFDPSSADNILRPNCNVPSGCRSS